MGSHLNNSATLEEGLLSRSKISDDSTRTDSEASVSVSTTTDSSLQKQRKACRHKELFLAVFGVLTLVVGIVLICVAVFIMDGDCNCQHYVPPESYMTTKSPTLKPLVDAKHEAIVSGDKHRAPTRGPDEEELQADSNHPNLNYVNEAIVDFNMDHLPNLLKGKRASQSSTISSPNGKLLEANLALDGSMDNSIDNGSCAQTEQEYQPLWYADIGSYKLVKRVNILLPEDCCRGDMHNFEVRIGQNTDMGLNALCRYYLGSSLQTALIIECDRQIYGRYISIQILGNQGLTSQLTICEVKAFET